MRRQRAFTLLEMLVTLALVAMISGIVAQALAQLARVEQTLSGGAMAASKDLLRREWVRQLIRGCGPFLTDAPGLRGDRHGFICATTAPPWPGRTGPTPVRLSLEHDRHGRSVLMARAEAEAEPLQLMVWHGGGAFAYLGSGGQWRDVWPPPLGVAEQYPLAVRLSGLPGGALMGRMEAHYFVLPKRSDMEAL